VPRFDKPVLSEVEGLRANGFGSVRLVTFPADLRAGSADEEVEIDAFVGL